MDSRALISVGRFGPGCSLHAAEQRGQGMKRPFRNDAGGPRKTVGASPWHSLEKAPNALNVRMLVILAGVRPVGARVLVAGW